MGVLDRDRSPEEKYDSFNQSTVRYLNPGGQRHSKPSSMSMQVDPFSQAAFRQSSTFSSHLSPTVECVRLLNLFLQLFTPVTSESISADALSLPLPQVDAGGPVQAGAFASTCSAPRAAGVRLHLAGVALVPGVAIAPEADGRSQRGRSVGGELRQKGRLLLLLLLLLLLHDVVANALILAGLGDAVVHRVFAIRAGEA